MFLTPQDKRRALRRQQRGPGNHLQYISQITCEATKDKMQETNVKVGMHVFRGCL